MGIRLDISSGDGMWRGGDGKEERAPNSQRQLCIYNYEKLGIHLFFFKGGGEAVSQH